MSKMKYQVYFAIVFVLSNLGCFSCERLHEQIYSVIEGSAACIKLLNGTHETGCSSPDSGSVGVVQMVYSHSDVDWIVSNGNAGPYAVVVSTALFNAVIGTIINNPNNIAGILLYDLNNTTNEASLFTEESKCPNEYSSATGSSCSSTQTSSTVWNEPGTGILRQNIPFPIFYLPSSQIKEVEKVKSCYERFNLDKSNHKAVPLCSVQLTSFMYAAVNSVVCLRRSATSALLSTGKVCDPLGDQNVYYPLFPRGKKTGDNNKPVTLVTARIDTATLFNGLSPGAASSVVGMVAHITTAVALSKMTHSTDAALFNQNVIWTLLNGEAFDYIGSQRLAYDISQGTWPPSAPLLPSDIKLHLEIGQIGGSLLSKKDEPSWPFYAYAPFDVTLPTQVTEFLNYLTSNLNSTFMSVTPKLTQNLPPSSLHSFRRILTNVTENGALPELLLVDFDSTFSNMFYHSVLDDYEKIAFIYRNISINNNGDFISTEDLLANGTMREKDTQVKIARLGTGLARALYQQIAGKSYSGNISVSAHLVDEMLYCFLQSKACRLLSAANYGGASAEALDGGTAPLYVGVATGAGSPAIFAAHLLALLAGTHLPDDRTACLAKDDVEYSFYWLKGWNNSGVCIQTTMNFSQAVSPAFTIPDYDFTSGVYSTWTESVWDEMSAKVFVRAGGGGARLAAAAGACATMLAALLTFWLKRHAAMLFNDHSVVSIVQTDATTGILRSVNC